jgi:hypothetical protein
MATVTGAQNLSAAVSAMAYTAGKLRIGHTNVVSDALKTPAREIEALNRILPMRREIDKAIDDRFVADEDVFRTVQIIAEKAEKYATGNCEEQASTAFMYLLRLNKVNVDYCRWKQGKHAFVIVGRQGETTTKGSITEFPWFQDAVICDPQDRQCGYWSALVGTYPASNIISMLHREPRQLQVWQNK